MAECYVDGRPIKSLKVVELRYWLQRRGLKTGGNKKSLPFLLRCSRIPQQRCNSRCCNSSESQKFLSLPTHGKLIYNLIVDCLPTFAIENILDYLNKVIV